MKSTKIFIILIFSFFFNNSIQAKSPSLLITEIVDKASAILSSSDPVESKIIKLYLAKIQIKKEVWKKL